MNGIVSFRLCKLTDAELVERVDRMTDEMFQTGQLPTRQIPARPDKDFDLLVGELCFRFYHKYVKPSDGDIIEPITNGEQIQTEQ